jgi:AraC-like DNA-binding protein
MQQQVEPKQKPVGYSCHYSVYREGEQYVRQHSLGMIVSGVMELDDGMRKVRLEEGQLYSARKNHLLKFVKRPLAGREYSSLSIYFDEPLLQDVSAEYGYKAEGRKEAEAFVVLAHDDTIASFMHSLAGYKDMFQDESMAGILKLKQKEGLLLLLKLDPSLKDILFDFAGPARVDLEAFMQKNYHFNVPLDRFAYLTGRSLSTFKRDFERIFHSTPSRWLLRRRLEEAHHLIATEGRTASDIYLELGFEDLSHFSYCFKKQFGEAPSRIGK